MENNEDTINKAVQSIKSMMEEIEENSLFPSRWWTDNKRRELMKQTCDKMWDNLSEPEFYLDEKLPEDTHERFNFLFFKHVDDLMEDELIHQYYFSYLREKLVDLHCIYLKSVDLEVQRIKANASDETQLAIDIENRIRGLREQARKILKGCCYK